MSRSLPYAGVDTFQVVMGVITRMLARPELPPDCAFAQQLQELMRRCWCEEPADRPRFNQAPYISPTSPLDLPLAIPLDIPLDTPQISPRSRLDLA